MSKEETVMGRWDNHNDEKINDKWNEEFNTDFDWKESEISSHPVNCNCPKHEYIKEKIKTTKELPIIYKYCPQHFKAWHETKNEAFSKMKWWQRIITKFALKKGWIQIKELTHAQASLCFWCRFGSGGRGIKTNPLSPDIP